jgi:hypothetical protein
MQHAQSRFLKVAVVSRFLVQHPKVSRFIANHLLALCPFLPLPTDRQNAGAIIPTPPQSTRFISLNLKP